VPVSKQNEKMLTIPVIGMTCASCVRRVERALSKKEGVASASVSFAAEKATVEYDPKTTSPNDLIGTIEGVGYGTDEREATMRRKNREIKRTQSASRYHHGGS
jgi:Cu+-exporting ATPase